MKKLKQLIVSNFEGIEKATLDLSAPVTLLVGTNNQGKSSLLDAVKFAWTGKARAVSKFKDAITLAYAGAKKFAVKHVYLADDGTECTIERTPDNASKNIDPDEILPFCLDPKAFVLLSSKERGKILSSLTSSGLEELIAKSIAEHIGDFPAKVINEIKTSGADVYDIDALRGCVVSTRQDAKRVLKGLRTNEPTFAEFELPDDYVVEIDEDKITELDRRIANGSGMVQKAAEFNFAKATLLDLQNKERVIRDELKKLPKAIGQKNFELKLEQAKAIVTLATLSIKTDEKECPLCKTKGQYKKLLEAGNKATAWINEQREQTERANTIEVLTSQLEQRVAQVGEARKKVEAFGKTDLPKNSEQLLKKYTEGRDKLKENVFNYRKFKVVSRETSQNIETQTELNDLIEDCNRVDEALKDGSPVKTDIAAGGKKLPINQALLEAWEMYSLELRDNGELIYKGRAIEHASTSEQYRAGCLLGCALAELSGTGFAIIDGLEILDDANKNSLISYIQESDINNVLIGYTASSINGVPAYDELPAGITGYLVKDGSVEKIKK